MQKYLFLTQSSDDEDVKYLVKILSDLGIPSELNVIPQQQLNDVLNFTNIPESGFAIFFVDSDETMIPVGGYAGFLHHFKSLSADTVISLRNQNLK